MKMDLALNNLQRLICHKTKQTKVTLLPKFRNISCCSTMWVGRQSRRFLCLFWRETRQRILGHEISPYPEVGRGREWELAGLRSWEAVDGGPGREQLALDSREELATGPEGEQLALDSREASSRELAWNHGQGQSTLDSGDSRGDKIGSSEEDWVSRCLHSRCLWNFR